ncbi:VOC family protein [Tenacibaculum sp. UWU-22]|uniref:VOC family protein n=1 Tax=Tenacibaculum sp. UWU-22 TaxID=3234187 RepID=UPI0034DB6761
MSLKGIATINFTAHDLEKAEKWYSEFLGVNPYFKTKGYIEFRIGAYQQELGIIDSNFLQKKETNEPSGVIVYWHVDDINSALDKLKSMNAKVHQPIMDRSNGFFTASVIDPFGNILGIMTNPHFAEILSKK